MQDNGNVSGSTFFRKSERHLFIPTFEKHTEPPRRVVVFSRESDTSFLLKTILEMWGYQTETAETIEKTLSLIELHEPHLILLDSVLPFDRHLENISRLRRNDFSREIPIIVISGFSQSWFMDESIGAGADGFLVKPLDFDLLESCLARAFKKND